MKEQLKKYAWHKFRGYPKTREITELRDELYSMMCDRYDDCIASGMSERESAERARELMNDCKSAVREVELNSSMGGLRRKLIDLLALSAALMLTLTGVYLLLSLVVCRSFDKTWLLIVTGAFAYVVYVAVSLFRYARMFRFTKLTRIAFAGIFLSLVPLLYVLPGLIAGVVCGIGIWSWSWVVLPLLALVYLAADTAMFARTRRALTVELAADGFALATAVYLWLSVFHGKWNVAWLVYVLYLAAVAFVIYFAERRRGDE